VTPKEHKIKRSKPSNGNWGKHVTSVNDNTLAHADALRAHVLDVVVWVTKLQTAQRLHGIIGVTLRDPEW